MDLRSEASTDCADDCVVGTGVNNNSQPKPKRSKRACGITTEQSIAINDTLDRVMSQIANSPGPAASYVTTDTYTARSDKFEMQLEQQQVVMKCLEQKIDFLVNQLQRVCNFLGLPTAPIQSNTSPPVDQTEECSVIADVMATGVEPAESANPDSHLNTVSKHNRFSDIISDVIAKECHERDNRARSVIISGLP